MLRYAAIFVLALIAGIITPSFAASDQTDNIEGVFAVKYNWHYSNKTTVAWGENSLKDLAVKISLSASASSYDCTNTTTYSCEDSAYQFDWNKLWGKIRCGYLNGNHDDSDRFVFRKCSDSSCIAYDGTPRIQIGAYSYDNGVAPYTGENPELLKTFKNTIAPDTVYTYQMTMDASGLTTFILKTDADVEIERQTVQHGNLCESNYNEGLLQGLYFGGTCKAPVEIVAVYSKA